MPSFQAAMDHFYASEYDQEFRGDAPRKRKNTTYQYFKCSRHGKYEEKNRTKKNVTCYAHIVIVGNEDSAEMYGCREALQLQTN